MMKQENLMQLNQYRWVQGWHINASGKLFGGSLLSWVDEDATMLAHNIAVSGTKLVTAGMDKISFINPSLLGDKLFFNHNVVHVGKASVTIHSEVSVDKNKIFEGFSTLVAVNHYGVPKALELIPEAQIDTIKNNKLWQLVETMRVNRKKDAAFLKE